MDQEHNMISEMQAITISREYGSGGGEIAARLAHRLRWQLIDHEVVVRVAQELGVSEAEVEEHDEYAESLASRILYSFQVVQPTMPVSLQVNLIDVARFYHEACQRVVESAVTTGHVVIVGRAAQVQLAKRRDVLHVRIVAPLEQRIAYVMGREGLNREAAQARIQLKDRDRIRYLQVHYHEHPANAHLYDLVVNTSVLNLESVVDLLVFALERKAQRLSIPAGELGPAAGLAQYPEPPGDIHPPGRLSE